MSGRIARIMLWLLVAATTSAQAQTVEYLHTDALGSVVAVTDANRNVLERREYEPYGSQLTPAVANGPGYTGHVQDAATGLVYMQQRYYDAQIGRFLSMDPVTANSGTGANFNRYWYGDNNPYTFIDPTGTCTGSRIENKDGTCVSSGGNTTETYGARQGEGNSTGGWTQIRDTVSDAWDEFKYNVQCMWTCQWPGDGGLQAVLVALPEFPGGALEQAGTRIYTSGASFLGRIATKAIYLPAWRKVSVDMAHIAERHIAGGASTAGKTVFPGMNETSVMRAIRQAYESSTKIGVQGTDRILLMGHGAGLKIEMWFNKATKTIETAYPVVQ